MNKKAQQIQAYQTRVEQIKKHVLDSFYYLEAEALRYKPAPDKWSISEVMEHINLVNHFYIKSLSKAVHAATDGEEAVLRYTWFGKKFARTMAPRKGEVTNKMPTFRKINPVARAKQGYAVVEKVVFQNFMDDLDQLSELLKQAREKKVNRARIKTFAPLLRLSFGDGVEVLLNHTDRHLVQAGRVLSQKG